MVSNAPSRILNVAVGGPQAVGKTSTLRIISRLRPDIDILFFGEQLPATFQEESPAEKDRVRTEVAGHIASKLTRRERVTLVDLHYLDLREPNPRIQHPEFLVYFDLLVFLSVSPEALWKRRAGDTGRSNRPMQVAHVEREVDAHLRYFDELVSHGVNATLIDCQSQALEVAKKLLRQVDRGEHASG